MKKISMGNMYNYVAQCAFSRQNYLKIAFQCKRRAAKFGLFFIVCNKDQPIAIGCAWNDLLKVSLDHYTKYLK